MNGFTDRTVQAANLLPGDRVQWWGDTFRVVHSVQPMADGTDHLRVSYANDTSARYAGKGLVRVLDLAPIEVPVEIRTPSCVDGLSWTDA